MTWRKSTFSDTGDTCVEVTLEPTNPIEVRVRNSNLPDRVAVFTVEAWRTFLEEVKAGMFDL